MVLTTSKQSLPHRHFSLCNLGSEGRVTKGIIAFRFIGSCSCDDQWFEHPEILSENFSFVAFISLMFPLLTFCSLHIFSGHFWQCVDVERGWFSCWSCHNFPYSTKELYSAETKQNAFCLKKKKSKSLELIRPYPVCSDSKLQNGSQCL